MSKRGADNYMTDQNWDQEEETEEAGIFKQADTDTIKRRQIKKASRRGVNDESTSKEEGTASTFKGFTGFSGFSKTNPSAAFGSLSSKPLTFSNGSAPPGDAPKPSLFSIAKTDDTKPDKDISVTKAETEKIEQKPPPLTNGNGDSKSPKSSRSKYLHQLKSLNESVTRWIKEHVDKNPYCILTPIFKDYEKYLSDLEKKYPQQDRDKEGNVEETMKDVKKTEITSPPVSTPKFSFSTSESTSVAASGGFSMTKTSTSPSSTAPVFSFGNKSLAGNSGTLGVKPASTEASSGIFGTTTTSSSSSTTSAFSGFNFGAGSSSSVFGSGASGSGFSFGDAAKKAVAGSSKAETSSATEEDEYVPPKQDVTEIKEDDAIYSKRCKLFFKKGDQWKEKGVGNLHLKPCGEKTQLLIRADTNLGNILLNIMLASSLPLTRQGKNNVALVCVPNPPIEGVEESSMVPMLIRVKTGDDADELLEKLKEHKS